MAKWYYYANPITSPAAVWNWKRDYEGGGFADDITDATGIENPVESVVEGVAGQIGTLLEGLMMIIPPVISAVIPAILGGFSDTVGAVFDSVKGREESFAKWATASMMVGGSLVLMFFIFIGRVR